MMIAILLVMKHYELSDREVIQQIKENRYMQYFCNVPDKGLMTFLHPSSLFVLRKRLGEEGISFIEKDTFEVFRSAGVIKGDNALTDSTVLESNQRSGKIQDTTANRMKLDKARDREKSKIQQLTA